MNKNNIKFIAHRGYSYLETENTLSAFEKALESDFYGIEIDIHLSKDKQIIVHHDDTTNRLGNKSLVIKESLYSELKEVRLKDINTNTYKKEIPLLKEVLELSKKYNKHSIVEIKPSLNIDELKLVNNLLKKYEKITVISFDLNNLINLRKINKKISLEYLTSVFNEDNFMICKKNNINLDLNYKLINKDNMNYFKKHNFTINCWTVNDYNIAQQLTNLKVDYITSDKINKIEK